MSKTFRPIIGILAIFISLILTQNTVHAATPSGVTVSPVVQNLTIQAGQPQIGTEFLATNNTPATVTLSLSIVDFNTLDESGGVLFAGTKENALTKKYGLTNWTKLDQNQLTLEPGQSQIVHALITADKSLTPGGHYGAVLFALNAPTIPKGKVGLNQVVSSLLFVSKLGGERYELSLQKPASHAYWANLPQKLTLRFHNTGNEHVVPRGTLTVTGPLGKIAATGVINEASGIILPETYRRYPVTLTQKVSSLLPGYYTVHIKYRFDGHDSFTSLSYGFWVLNLQVIIGALILLAALVWLALQRRAIWAKVAKRRPDLQNH